jgi:hypothetical protein
MTKTPRITLEDYEHNIIYGAVIDLREDFVDLKQHVNDELEIQKRALELKAAKADINLWLLWKQSPLWMKIVGAAGTAVAALASAAAGYIPLP